MKRQQEGGHLQAKERHLKRNQPCQYLLLGRLACRTMRIHISAVVSHPVVFCSLSKLTQLPSNHPHRHHQQKILVQLRLGRRKSECFKSTRVNPMPALLGLCLEKGSYQRELCVLPEISFLLHTFTYLPHVISTATVLLLLSWFGEVWDQR